MTADVFEVSSFKIAGGFGYSLEGKGSDFKDTSIAPLIVLPQAMELP
jgi:hypothetical protein